MCRKTLADTRPRVRGRFARNNDAGAVMPHETKKALAAKAKAGKAAAAAQGQHTPGTLFQQPPCLTRFLLFIFISHVDGTSVSEALMAAAHRVCNICCTSAFALRKR